MELQSNRDIFFRVFTNKEKRLKGFKLIQLENTLASSEIIKEKEKVIFIGIMAKIILENGRTVKNMEKESGNLQMGICMMGIG